MRRLAGDGRLQHQIAPTHPLQAFLPIHAINVCACVEDDKHFLLECPVYESIRMKYKNVFNEDSTTTSVLNCPDQNLFGRVLHEMLLHRSTFI